MYRRARREGLRTSASGRKRPLRIKPKADVGIRFREAGTPNVRDESDADCALGGRCATCEIRSCGMSTKC